MNQFTESPKCLKCNCDEVDLIFQLTRLKVICKRCGYSWDMKTADDKGKPDPGLEKLVGRFPELDK